MMHRVPWRLSPPSLLLLAAACSGDGSGPVLPQCTAGTGFAVSLAVGQWLAIDPVTDSGCVAFGVNAGIDTAEYVVVPLSATGTPGLTAAFRLVGSDTAGPILASAALTAPPPPRPVGEAERFHWSLREAEQARRYAGTAAPAGAPPAMAAVRAASPPPVVGHVRQFSVCSNVTCSRFQRVTATALAVGQRLAIYVDNTAPLNGLNTQDLDTLITEFDARLYAVDTAAFGRESDVDGNGAVLVLMTNVVNKLVTAQQCQTDGFVAGFFFGADIDPAFAGDARFNHGEVFYSIVADPSATLSCAHSRDQVKRVVPVTFVHEFQHMISYNQHVLVRNGAAEVLWLNEALSHFAEELGGRSYLPGDQASFSRFLSGNAYNAYQYLDSVGTHFLLPTAGIGSLAERGSGWLFVRFITDQFAADTTQVAHRAFARTLVATNLTGAANVANATGEAFATTVTKWALANWVSDLPGFTTPPELMYRSWRFRTTFASLNQQSPGTFPKVYPLTPTVGRSDSVHVTGVLHAGSGVYHRILQPPGGAGFLLLLSDPSRHPLPAVVVPRLDVVRVR